MRSATLGRAAAVALAAALTVLPAASARADSVRDADWALDVLHAHDAWRTTQGAGVTVAVLDTGVDGGHPDLAGQVLAGNDLVGFGAGPGDSAWAKHGTGMAGIIAGHGHGPGHSQGVLGIAPGAKILPVRVILEEKDPKRDQARATKGAALPEGIRWAADHGAGVINLSLGDDSATAAPAADEDNAIQYALSKGVVVVASAGNGGEHADRASYPAAYPGVIAVAAVDRYGAHATFSTRRWYASVSAPGVDVVLADPDRKYYEGWGTSPASAYVSGAVALIRSAYPKLSPAQIKRLLEDTTRDRPAGGRSDAVGTGLMDPAAALKAAAKLQPQGEAPSPAPFAQRYFGSGPSIGLAPVQAGGGLGDGVAITCALLGTALVAAAGLFWFRPRLGRSPRGATPGPS
ncbi:type VII secretion-associated serine protease mycosin [Streptomyces sp. H10-C2]|uniref:type VII secretion-associated serine protease mycosin n=1 Tax=unclassified Streptomyces TaxID=2593676 RepID=UPI0024BB34ED|nr:MULTISPECIES: type VII secretion-associated serine protease mycosin [unclassified Streptomyces]MDJ0343747.1 type VII secretion-associated serine protease mycosin [Streptomyces sp. PH10-H1]MDJ0373268.1 type VII secretion-associated serine protease mycosin [Streptomyces sp. H10-C2]